MDLQCLFGAKFIIKLNSQIETHTIEVVRFHIWNWPLEGHLKVVLSIVGENKVCGIPLGIDCFAEYLESLPYRRKDRPKGFNRIS